MSALPELPHRDAKIGGDDFYLTSTVREYGALCRKQALEDVTAELEGMTCNNATARSAIKLCIETIKEMK